MVKVISLSDAAYGKLKSIKRNKSFSEVIVDLVDYKKKNLLDFVGIWKADSSYWEKFKQDVRKSRDEAKLRKVDI